MNKDEYEKEMFVFTISLDKSLLQLLVRVGGEAELMGWENKAMGTLGRCVVHIVS